MTVHGRVGVSYRRLDYWTRCGYLRPEHAGGSGNRRRWSETELAVAEIMARLVDAGLTIAAAADAARTAHETAKGGTAYAHLAEGVYLSIVLDVDENTRPRARATAGLQKKI